MKKLKYLLIILTLLFVLSIEYLCAINIYMNKFAYTYNSRLTVNDIAIIQGEQERNTISNLYLDIGVQKLSLIPARLLIDAIEPYYTGSIIIIGSRTAVIPIDVYPQETLWFYKELLSFIDSLDPVKNGRIELEVLSSFSIPDYAIGTSPIWSLVRSSRTKSYLSGEIVVSYTFSGNNLSYNEKQNILPVYSDNLFIEREFANTYNVQNDSSFNGNIRLRVNQYVPVPVLKSSVLSGEQVTANKIVIQEMEISEIQDDFFNVSQESVEQYTFSRNLNTGSIISYGDVEKIQLVRNGDTVQISFNNNNIQIITLGEALNTGSYGEIIRVKPENSNQTFDGTVTGMKEVRIDIP